MSMLAMKYLFGALLEDGTERHQHPEDICETPGRTSFFNLLKLDDKGDPIVPASGGFAETRDDIQAFQLKADDGTCYVVDLRDGHFEVQVPLGKKRHCRAFWIAVPPPDKKLKLFYFRRRRHHANATVVVDDDLKPQITKMEDAGEDCEYHFGWETEDRKIRAEMIVV